MSLVSVERLSYSHIPGAELIRKATFTIDPGDRIGLIGPNGSGKTTLLRLLAGDLPPDAGRVVRRRGLTVAYLERMDAARSSGERMREALARIMRSDAGLILLDEPTNHLDSAARDWLSQWLTRQRVTCVLVSHDRAFLNQVTTRTLAIARGEVRIYNLACDAALAEREAAGQRQWQDYGAQQRRIAAAEAAARKRDALARKVAEAPPGARHSQDFYARKAAKVARTGRLLREREQL